VTLQVLLAFGIASPFLFKKRLMVEELFLRCKCGYPVNNALLATLVALQFLHFHYAGGLMDFGRSTWMWVLTRSPWNFICLFLYALLSGVVMGFQSLSLRSRTVGILALALLGVVLTLSVYARWTSRDWSATELGKALRGLIFVSILFACFHVHGVCRRLLSLSWAGLFCVFLVQHTQLMFGTARQKHQLLEFTLDMYALAAFLLYNVYMNVLLCSLQAFTGK